MNSIEELPIMLVDAKTAPGERRFLRKGAEHHLGTCIYVILEKGSALYVADKKVEDATSMWIAHSPSVLAVSERNTTYGLLRHNGYPVILPQGEITFVGEVQTPEIVPFSDLMVSGRTEETSRRVRDPYRVVVLTGDNRTEYKNVPEVSIRRG